MKKKINTEETQEKIDLFDKKDDMEEMVDEPVVKKDDNELTDEKIVAWKKEHKKIYKTVISDQVFIWKKLKRGDYIAIKGEVFDGITTQQMAALMQEESIVKRCVLYPSGEKLEEVIDEYAGIATSLADSIMEKSGFPIRVFSQEL